MKLFFQRLLREPLVHFITIGGLMFVVYAAMNEQPETPPEMIVISSGRIDQLKSSFSAVWKREPKEDEINAMIDEDIREEVYYRDGVALGLDRNDSIVRRRLRLKMEFLMDSSAHALEPAAGELEAFYVTNAEDYETELRLAFEQVYLGENPDPNTISRVLDELSANPETDTFILGKPTNLPSQLGYSSEAAVFGVFGKGLFQQLTELAPNVWAGPVKSTYGIHLVRILDRIFAAIPPLQEVRNDVLRDWKALKRQEIADRDYEKRRKKYLVEVHRQDNQPAAVQ